MKKEQINIRDPFVVYEDGKYYLYFKHEEKQAIAYVKEAQRLGMIIDVSHIFETIKIALKVDMTSSTHCKGIDVETVMV